MDSQKNKLANNKTAAKIVDVNQRSEKSHCAKCGIELTSKQHYCPNCGQQIDTKLEEKSSNIEKSRIKKAMIGIVLIVITIAIIFLIVFVVRGTQARSVTLNKDSITIKIDDTAILTYVIDPDNTKDKAVTWDSSNELIAKVNGGVVTGINEGNCVVTVITKNGKTDACSVVIIPAGPDLKALYEEYCTPSFANIASDGSYLAIDTNPSNIERHYDHEAFLAIETVNKELGLPDTVMHRMEKTRSMDGIQTYSTDEIELSWTYHPDKGLEVTYSLK